MECKKVFGSESIGMYNIAIQLLVTMGDREFDDTDSSNIYPELKVIEDKLQARTDILNEQTTAQLKETKENIIKLFNEPVYVLEIPNEYGKTWYYRNRPWFMIWTKVGPIKIGWRSSVMHIEWTTISNRIKAEDLFPESTSTKYDYIIHAWSYQEAKQYIDKILGVN